MIRCTTKVLFTPGDLGFLNFDTPFGRIGTLILLDQWYPEGARLSSLAARIFCFIQRLSAGIPAKKSSTAPRNWTPGRPFSARTQSRTAFNVAAANRVGYEGPPASGIEFLGIVVCSDLRARDRSGLWDRKKFSSPIATPRARRSAPALALHARFAASTLIAPIVNRWLK